MRGLKWVGSWREIACLRWLFIDEGLQITFRLKMEGKVSNSEERLTMVVMTGRARMPAQSNSLLGYNYTF